MTDSSAIRLLVYKEITPGDLRKFSANASNVTTGRGARDLRFPHDIFDPIFARLLPTLVDMPGRRNKVASMVAVRTGPVRWYVNDVEGSTNVEYWPPNEARPGEGRWAKVNTIPLFRIAQRDDEGRIVILLVQNFEGNVYLYIETETRLRTPEWNSEVVDAIFSCSDSKKNGTRSAALGYIDFDQDKKYCHG